MVETIILGLNVTNVISFVTFHIKLGNLSNDDGDGNKNGKKKQEVSIGKITTLHMHPASFVHFFAVVVRQQRESA